MVLHSAFWLVFVICMLASLAIVAFYAKKQKHPLLKPKAGELLLMTMLFGVVSAFVSWVIQLMFFADRIKDLSPDENSSSSGVSSKSDIEYGR